MTWFAEATGRSTPLKRRPNATPVCVLFKFYLNLNILIEVVQVRCNYINLSLLIYYSVKAVSSHLKIVGLIKMSQKYSRLQNFNLFFVII